METLSGRQKSGYPSSLLDTKDITARRRFKRMYHRVRSGLSKPGVVRLLTLTTSPEASSRNYQADFRKLQMRLKRRGLIEDYIRCPERTESGLRHDHIIFRGSYIEQAYLSYLWAKIHDSPVVDIRRVRGRHSLACYLANYLAKSPAGRYSYSWGWVWKGFAGSWKILKRFSRGMGWDYKYLLTIWQNCVIWNVRPENRLIECGYVFSSL